MNGLALTGIAVALAMDAFAVALATGLALERLSYRHLFRLGFHFGLFQAMMPIIGWLSGLTVREYMEAYDHWIAFGLLGFVGGKMIHEAFAEDEPGKDVCDPTTGMNLILLSVATSIDALAVGLSLAMISVSIWIPALVIGLVASAFTVAGMLLGRRIGTAWGPRVEVLGGFILFAIGFKILYEHLG